MEPARVKANGRKFALNNYKDLKGELRPCVPAPDKACNSIITPLGFNQNE
ncbi:MAG: hypothetical protein J5661_02665 [Bacteroidaceae bacterium]|nr:hypothetical protein [Bacteroidaceae bacterium]